MHCGVFRVVIWGLLFGNFQLFSPGFLQALAPTSSLKTSYFNSHNVRSFQGGLLGGNSNRHHAIEKTEALQRAIKSGNEDSVYAALREFRSIPPDSLKDVVPVIERLMIALGEGSSSLPGILRWAIAEDLLEYSHRLFVQSLEGNVTARDKQTLKDYFLHVRRDFRDKYQYYQPRFLLAIGTTGIILDSLPGEKPDKYKKGFDVAKGLAQVVWAKNPKPLFEFASWAFDKVKGQYNRSVYQTLIKIKGLSETSLSLMAELTRLQKIPEEKSRLEKARDKIGKMSGQMGKNEILLFYVQALTDVILKTGNARIRNQAYYGVLTSKNGIMKKRYGLIPLLEKYLSKGNITITQTIIESLFVIADNKDMTNGIKTNAAKRLRTLENDSRFRFVFDEKRETLGFSKRLAQAQREPTAEELSRQRIFLVLDQIFEKELEGQIKLEEIGEIVMNINDQKQVFIQEIKNLEGKIDRNYEGINRTHQATVGVRNQINGLDVKADRILRGQQEVQGDLKAIKDHVVPKPAADEKKVEALIEVLREKARDSWEDIKAFEYYIRPEGTDSLDKSISLNFDEKLANNRFDLEEKVVDFLKSDARSFVLLGDGGFGKTTFARHMERVLWEKYERDKVAGLDVSQHWIPLYIHLERIDLSKGKYLEQFFESLEDDKGVRIVDDNEVKLLRRSKHRFFVTFDGFDEVLAQGKLYNKRALSAWGKPKLMALSRTKYLPYDPDIFFRVEGKSPLKSYVGFLTPEQQGAYIRNYVFANISEDKQERLETTLNHIENSLETLDILLTPLELEQVLDILLESVNASRANHEQKIRRLDIYMELAQSWLGREYERMALFLDKKKINVVIGERLFQKFLQDMSWAMFEHETLILDERKAWARSFLNRESLGFTGAQIYQIREYVFQFIDETLRDYYAMQALLYDLGYDKEGDTWEKESDFSRWQKKPLSNNMIDFLADILDKENSGFYMGLQDHLREMASKKDPAGQKTQAALNAQLVLEKFEQKQGNRKSIDFFPKTQKSRVTREFWLSSLREAA